ncbi:MAG: histidine--tRNA ligase [Bacteroidetes bacterium]|jgi:histidyl-tRNA synthetase|nr:MAG: histidine--tRNA ligase [Bacteroidota bacterium]PTM19692.1 MAG: histidine--tRNA ligase [Bacteroidota bacterium]
MAELKYQTHHGMTDLLPDETRKWQALEQIIRREAAKFHFEEIRTPVLEPTELIVRGLGQLTDIVSKEIFAFQRGDTNYVLRPEMTAPVARSYVEHRLDQRGGTQKLYYIGPMFRAERPQKGRQRQFHQFGLEVIGSADPIADIEVISFMVHIYQTIGIRNTRLRINSVGDLQSREAYKKTLKAYLKPHLPSMSELSRTRFEKNPMRILDSKEPEDQPVIEQAPLIGDSLSESSREHFNMVKKLLDDLGIDFEEDPYLVRGMDYYTETAFELISPDLGAQDALAGGGRYDLLIEEIGGEPTPAVGFAAGMERLLIACDELGIELDPGKSLDLYIVTMGGSAREWAVPVLQQVRGMGLSATMDYQGRSLKAQMKDANRAAANYTLIVGDHELARNRFTFRDMGASEEESLSLDEILERMQKLIGEGRTQDKA